MTRLGAFDVERILTYFTVEEKAQAVFKALAWFAMIQSSDPEKKKALEELQILRCQVQEKLDVIVPGWAEGL